MTTPMRRPSARPAPAKRQRPRPTRPRAARPAGDRVRAVTATLCWGWAGTSPRRHAVELRLPAKQDKDEATAVQAHDLALSLCGLRCHVRLFPFLPFVGDGLSCARCAELAAKRR